MNRAFLKNKPYLEVILLVFISALAYLPYVTSLTYYLDDWYYIYDGYVGGANIFHPMFSIDRPARGYFFDLYFSLFGPHPFPYHFGAYLWRVFAGVGAFWLLTILWQKNSRFNFFAAALFILYPGYTWWVSAVEYQPMIASLALQVFSVVLTLKVIQTSRFFEKVIYMTGAILTGWAYIALVDYAIGMEAFRFFCVYLFVFRSEQSLTILKKISTTIRVWAWNVVIPFGFILWRLFFFENQRKATDVNLQLSKFMEAPMDSLWKGFEYLFQSIANVGFNAWTKQLYPRLSEAGFQVSGIAFILAAGIVVLFIVAGNKLNGLSASDGHESRRMAGDAIFLGAISLLFGVLPVVAANRFVNLNIYSHYGLPASLASAILLVGLVYYFLPWRHVQTLLIIIFVTTAVLTHSLIAEKTLISENAIEKFWWQASWRIPGLRPDTTLVTLIVDNDYGLAQPANMIYFPESQGEIPIRYFVSALMPTNRNVDLIMAMSHKKTEGYRTHKEIITYGNILILTQPTSLSCVRVIDGTRHVLSENDSENIKKIAPYSKVENIRLSLDLQVPQEFAFGPEPERGWCYYFEQADLAVQKMDWEEAVRLGNEALQIKLYPADPVEWFPFLQAYAMLGDEEKVIAVSTEINKHAFLREQTCLVFNQPNSILTLDTHTKVLIDDLFCN